MDSPQPDNWNSGERYEPYVGRWSRLVASHFLTWLALPRGGHWVDCGCGTGALTRTIVAEAGPACVVGVDITAEYVAYAQAQITDPRVTFQVGDVQALDFSAATFDVAVSGLVLNFLPHPERMLAEMARVVRPGGTVALYVWDYAGEMQLMRRFWDAAVDLDPTATEKDEGRRFPICKPAPLEQRFTDVGLEAVATCAIDVPTIFRDFDDYWTPFLSGQGPAPGYAMSLNDARRTALRERLRATLPVAADGMIPLTARAWGVRGTNPPASR